MDFLKNNAHTSVNEESLEYVLDILADDCLRCPPPYDFTHEDFIRECPCESVERAGGEWSCRICWKRYLE